MSKAPRRYSWVPQPWGLGPHALGSASYAHCEAMPYFKRSHCEAMAQDKYKYSYNYAKHAIPIILFFHFVICISYYVIVFISINI